MKKASTSLLLSALQTIFIVFLITITVLSFGTKIKPLAQAGLNFYSVTSGSMEPTIPTGSLLLAGKYRLEDLKKGDIITYRLSNPETGETAVVTHRIEEVAKDEREVKVGETTEKQITYTINTKGDANSEPDNYSLNPGNIIGLYKWHIPYVGYAASFAQSLPGLITLVIVPGTILILWEVISLVLYFKNKDQSKKDKEIEELKKELAKKNNE